MKAVFLHVRHHGTGAHVPTDLHRRLKARAAIEGMSMSDFVMREPRKALERPTRREILERLRARPARKLGRRAADVIRAETSTRRRPPSPSRTFDLSTSRGTHS